MKLAFILKHFFYYSAQLIEPLALNHEVHVFINADSREVFQTGNIRERKEQTKSLFPQNVKLHFFRSGSRWVECLAFLKMMIALRRLQPDIIHAHRSFIRINLYYWIMKKVFCRSSRFILTVHDVNFHPGEESGFKGLVGFSHHLVYRAADRIIVHGDVLKRQLMDTYPELKDKVCVIPHGELSIFRRWAGLSTGDLIGPNEAMILCFGRMTPYKDLDTLIEAGNILSRRCDGFRIVIAGSGPKIKEKKADLERAPHFLCLDHYIPNEMVASLFARADVVVLPYIEASQSGVAALAYAFRKPVVATRVGALSESILDGKTGLLVSPADPREMSEALALILQDRELKKRMVRHIEQWVAKRLSWEKIAAQTMAVYRQ